MREKFDKPMVPQDADLVRFCLTSRLWLTSLELVDVVFLIVYKRAAAQSQIVCRSSCLAG